MVPERTTQNIGSDDAFNQHPNTAMSHTEGDERCRQIGEQDIEPGFSCPPKEEEILARRIHGAQVPEKWEWDSDEV
jgi:hypothetical protein